MAVCLLPGTEIAFAAAVEHQLTDFQLPFFGTEKLSYSVGRFRQVNLDDPSTHHDAIEFPDGKTLLLTRLSPGQHATVLQLPAQAPAALEAKTGADTAGRIIARQGA